MLTSHKYMGRLCTFNNTEVVIGGLSLKNNNNIFICTSQPFIQTQTQTQNIYWHVGKVNCQWPCTNI